MLRWIFFVTVFVAVMLFLTSSSCENMSSLTNEGVQNIASVFNTSNSTFGNLKINGNLTFSQTGSFNIIPSGMITPFFGVIPPPGWVICDGTNGTPNLSMRFLLGGAPNYRSDYPLTHYGGSASVVLTIDTIPSHTHRTGIAFTSGGSQPVHANSLAYCAHGYDGYCYQNNNSIDLIAKDPTTVVGNVDYTGYDSPQPIQIIPPYHCLSYIMKL